MSGLDRLAAMLLFLACPQVAAACTDALPQYGTLQLDAPGTAAVMRGGDLLRASNGAAICVADRILGNGTAGRVRTISGRELPFTANGTITMPDRVRGKLAWLVDLFTTRRIFVQAGSMAASGPHFALHSMIAGEPVAAPGRATLLVPMVPSAHPYRLSLYRADHSTPLTTVSVPADTTWVRIAIPRRRGSYVLAIDGTAARAAFRLASVRPSPLIAQAGLHGREAAFAHACMDPASNFLDAIQRLDAIGEAQEYLDALLVWQHASGQLDCATPVG